MPRNLPQVIKPDLTSPAPNQEQDTTVPHPTKLALSATQPVLLQVGGHVQHLPVDRGECDYDGPSRAAVDEEQAGVEEVLKEEATSKGFQLGL